MHYRPSKIGEAARDPRCAHSLYVAETAPREKDAVGPKKHRPPGPLACGAGYFVNSLKAGFGFPVRKK